MSLEEISHQIIVCKKCPLAKGRPCAIAGLGTSETPIIFISSSPNFETPEAIFDKKQQEFLNELIGLANLTNDQFYFTTLVKCPPPYGRDPLEEEIRVCTNSYLFAQIRSLKPKLIVLSGKAVVSTFFPQIKSVLEVQGKAYQKAGQIYLILNGVEAALRYEDSKENFKQSFLSIPQLIN